MQEETLEHGKITGRWEKVKNYNYIEYSDIRKIVLRRYKMRTIPFGYKMIDGIFVVDKLESEIVSWIYERHIRYREHPPAVLVEDLIEEYKVSKDQDISYEEAERMVSLDAIHSYLDKEVRLRVEAFNIYSKDESVKDLKHYLECPLDEFDIDEIIETYKKDLKRTFEEHRNPVMTGKLSDSRNRR